MNIYVAVQLLNAIVALVIFCFVAFYKQKKTSHYIFMVWLLVFLGWTVNYVLWGIQTGLHNTMFFMKALMFPTCFIHITHFHFVLEFTQQTKKSRKSLFTGYILAIIFFFQNINGTLYNTIDIVSYKPFDYWPTANLNTFFLTASQVYFVSLAIKILLDNIKLASPEKKVALRIFVLSVAIGWIGGLFNWFYWYRIPIPPVGNLGVTFYMVICAYLLLRTDILLSSLVIKKTFVYTGLTVFITLIYIALIILSERFFQSLLGYTSVIAVLTAAIIISLAFNPLRHFLNKFLDKCFFGKAITELSDENLRMRGELQKSDRLKAVATLAAGMAHEIKNPLTSIRTFAEYLPDKYMDPEFREKFKRIVVDEVDRVNNIVMQLLEFSKPTPPDLKRIDLGQLIDETLSLLENNFVKTRTTVVKNYASQTTIHADRTQLKQVFINLLLNSLQAMKPEGSITISVGADGPWVLVSIEDTGCGISKNEIDHIFDPFYTTKDGGTGLGLSIVRGIMEEHGGKIEVSSVLGTGTQMKLYFPNKF